MSNQNLSVKERQNASFWRLWNMNFGMFGIQYGWTLELANTSAIYEYLGANAEQIPLLWLAAPVSGLFVQPLIGYLSDRTWFFLGRRKPYILGGAIISSVALVLMPNAPCLWMAVALLWILDISINISMQPFRALVADLLPEKQQTRGYAVQSFFIGLGAVIASLSPWWLNNIFRFPAIDESIVSIPSTVKLSFYLGAIIFLATVIWTVATTKEYADEELPTEKRSASQISSRSPIDINKLSDRGIIDCLNKIIPKGIKQLVWVQFFTWLGIFAILIYFPTTVAHHIFGAVKQNSALYQQGIEWAGICISFYNFVCLIFSFFIVKITEITSRKLTLFFCLLSGGAGIVSLFWINDRYLILLPMICFGIAWAGIHSIPYAILANHVPPKNMGVYMGIFNVFIVLPQIVSSLGLGWIMINLLNKNSLLAVVLGGFCLLIAAIFVYGIDDGVEYREINPELLKSKLTNQS
ncbi:MFS transporter [Pleurocapsales cyanobacterium LEGE 06147]|nr:MFS transporter [Pleurocapsales cyanobacterium LEGE 06147]